MSASVKNWGMLARYMARFGTRDRARPKVNAVDRAILRIVGRARASQLWPATTGKSLAQAVYERRQVLEAVSENELRAAADSVRQELLNKGFQRDLVEKTFAIVSEATRRAMGFVQRPSQLAGAERLLHGHMIEMATGEGKTVTALLAAATAALAGRRTHVVTVNSYLAERDCATCAPVLEQLGLTSAAIVSDQDRPDRMRAFQADVLYADNKELAFEYLREHISSERRVSGTVRRLRSAFDRAGARGFPRLDFAIVDEADSVLIDEARTPLIIAQSNEAGLPDWCHDALEIAAQLSAGRDYSTDLKRREISLTPRGQTHVAHLARQSSPAGPWGVATARREMCELALSALHLFQREVQYMVDEDKVVIIDESTGRAMPDRAWQAGLHQLIEAKEGVPLTAPRVTQAKISFRALFAKYRRLSGMTGTGSELAGEMRMMFQLRFARIALHSRSRRVAYPLKVCWSAQEKWSSIARDAERIAAREGRAVLIGTRTVEASEEVSRALDAIGLEHVVLNARQSRQEAQIVEQAGKSGRVTVATNMAGRGTDIKLDSDVKDRGGLHVILSEYHASSRIDRQLIGRSARGGDPGSYRPYFSFEDDLVVANAPLAHATLRRCARAAGSCPPVFCKLVVLIAQLVSETRASSQRRLTDHQLEQQMKLLGFAGDR